MECAVCEVRSSIGFCIQCKKLLCEQCATVCDGCGKYICEDHVLETPHGRELCIECMEERNRKRSEHKDKRKDRRHDGKDNEDFSFAGLDGAEETPEAEQTLVLSGYRATPPWVLSLYAGIAAVAVTLVIFVFPGFARLAQPWTSYIAFVLAGISAAWAGLGLKKRKLEEGEEETYEEEQERKKSYYGLGTAGAAALLAVMSLIFRPGVSEEFAIDAFDDGREELSPTELEDWREERLNRFR